VSVRVVPTEEVIDLLPAHRTPTAYEVRAGVRVLERQGQIVPLVLDEMDFRPNVALVYAAVELGWPTMLVTDSDVTSG